MVDPEHPGPYFVGLIQPLGAIMPLAEAQAEWLITGEGALPSYDAMRVQIREYDERVRRRFASGRDTIQVDFDQHLGGEAPAESAFPPLRPDVPHISRGLSR